MRLNSRPVRVAVLGGGCAGMSAAFALSRTPELRRRFQVTVYEQGFRLGGKGASGRNLARGSRIEEHGLHIWMGFYQRAFSVMRECYDAWEAPPDAPFHSVDEAFSPHTFSSLAGPSELGAVPEFWHLDLPPQPQWPWDEGMMDLGDATSVLWHWARAQLCENGILSRYTGSTKLLQRVRTTSSLIAAIARGLLNEVLPHAMRYDMDSALARIDHEDLCAFLRRWGAKSSESYDAPPIRALYNLAFAYPDGISRYGGGQLAAGAGLKTLLRMLTGYRRAPIWRMRAGMGDTVFAPLYSLLRQRGVRFAFFHRVTRMSPDRRERGLGRIELRREARVRGGAFAYEPLIDVRGLPAWPNAPLWHQIECNDPKNETEPEALSLVHGEDFDAAILAIPAPCHAEFASDLLRLDSRYRRMLERTKSVATIAAQLWLREPLSALGWPHPPTVCTSLRGPLTSWADMSETIAHESWPVTPKAAVYLCDVCPDREGSAHALRELAKADLATALDDSFLEVWPRAGNGSGRFDRSLIVDQYVRLNDEASERYILTLPGTTQYRLAADESGLDGLYFAGDWTRTSINGGSVEAAFESGHEAANAIVRDCG